jgi:ubiquitin carboxyl-terminal hydrolase 34
MEDADSSVTRKRPRLDSGERTYRSMSADPGFTTTSYPVQTSQPPAGTTPELEVSSKEQLDTTPLDNPQLGTPSKVTINVRDYGTSTSPIQTHTTLVKKAKRVESPPSPSPIQPMSAGKPKPSQTSSSTTSSSASGSPHIEIGEPEDMDDKPQAEMWLDSNAVPPEDPRQMADQLMATFPEIRNFRSFRDLLQKMGLFLAQQDLGDGTLINRLGGWMEDYVRCTSNYPHLWRKFCIDYIECFERIPQLINCLLGRTEPFDAKFVQIPEGNVTLDNRNFFKVLSLGFTSLTLRMLQIDATELEDSQGDSTTTPRLLSPRYIIALGHLCNPAESHLWKLLFHTYKYNIYDPVTSVHSRLISRDGLRLVTGIITALLNRTTSSTELQLHAVSMLTAATQFCLEGTPAPSVPPKLLPTDSSISQEFLSLFEAVNAQLQISIRKQSSSLSFENLNPLVNDLEFVLLRITSRDHELCKKILDNTVGLEYGESSERLPELATIVWKSQLLKLCITKGRMEARLFGVETLAQNLISVWEQRIKDRSSWTADVVVQYLADFILRSKIIDYLVGVESHPQLLTRGKNVLGFLAVTDRYSNDQTDLIWNAVITSQDPRTVDAILESLLKGIFDLIHYSHILYWVEKLQSLPYTRYEGQMLHFCRELLAALIKKYETKADDLDRMAVAPYLLLVQMLQTASADDSLKDSRARSTWVLASEMLSKFLRRGPDSTHRLKIFTTCLGHLSSASPGTSGNIATINALLNVDDFSTYEASMGDYSSFVGVMTAEFERFASARAGTANSDPTYEPLLLIRLELLFKTLVRVPDSFTDKQTESLWISTVGHLAMNGNARQLAWHTLQRVAKACPNGNVFLDKCLNKHFFVLKPDYFTESALIFAESTVDYATPEQPNGNLLADSLLWHISITVTSEAIGESAIESLIKVYLNLGAEETIGADSYHDKLVERCIQELSDAASIMEAAKIGSETNAGTDMPSTDDLAAQKRRFSRNLSLLKAYLQAVRAKFPAIQPRDISESPQSVHGDQIRLAYQPYDGGKSFGIKHIEIGNLATLGDLIARLKKLTTFSSFRVISGGQNLDILKFNDTLLRDLSLEKKGLILLQKVPGAPPYGDRPVPVRLQPLEAEVMQNFEKLYDLLEIDVDLGHEVFRERDSVTRDWADFDCRSTISSSLSHPLRPF